MKDRIFRQAASGTAPKSISTKSLRTDLVSSTADAIPTKPLPTEPVATQPALAAAASDRIPWRVNIGGVDVDVLLSPMKRLPPEGEGVLVFMRSEAPYFRHHCHYWFAVNGAWAAKRDSERGIDPAIIEHATVDRAAGWCYMPHTSYDFIPDCFQDGFVEPA